MRLVIVALVVVELPTIKLAIEAKEAMREEMKELVLVLLVEKRLVAVALVIAALVAVKLVANKLVEELLVIIEDEAKMFCAKRLRNLFRLEPML